MRRGQQIFGLFLTQMNSKSTKKALGCLPTMLFVKVAKTLCLLPSDSTCLTVNRTQNNPSLSPRTTRLWRFVFLPTNCRVHFSIVIPVRSLLKAQTHSYRQCWHCSISCSCKSTLKPQTMRKCHRGAFVHKLQRSSVWVWPWNQR